VKEIEKITKEYNILERAKNSIKEEKGARERELDIIRKEFTISYKSKDYL
jgi:hypothetical protein